MTKRDQSIEPAARVRLWPHIAIGVGLWLAVACGAFALARWLIG